MTRTVFMVWVVFVLNIFCNHSTPGTEKSASPLNTKYLIFKTPSGFGYDIYVNDKIIIHQAHIPAIGGRQSFKTEMQASKAAELVLHKIEKNILPPSVSPAELDSLGLLPGTSPE